MKKALNKSSKKAIKRFEFGSTLNFLNREYRYLYTIEESDIFIRDTNKPKIFGIPSKFIKEVKGKLEYKLMQVFK